VGIECRAYAQCPIPTGFIEWGGFNVAKFHEGLCPNAVSHSMLRLHNSDNPFALQDGEHMFASSWNYR